MPSAILISAVGALLVFLVYTVLFSNTKRLPKGAVYPPGPPGKPLLGNLLDIPSKHSWLQFKTWADQYGPLLRLNIGGREHYVVSTEKIANDLMRERGNVYSSREQLPAAAILLSDGLRPVFLPYNDVWRNGRKLIHHCTMATQVHTYEPAQLLESSQLLYNLIQDPDEYEHVFERYTSGLIMRLGFGKRIMTGQEQVIKRIISVNRTLERVASPGAYLVDTFPILMRLPTFLAPFKRELKELHHNELTLFRELMEDVRTEMQAGTAPPCWERKFLEDQAQYGLTDDQGAYVVGTMFEAGAGTTAAAMMSTMLSLTHHPEWVAAMQEELDRVVGPSRLPNFQDMPNLPTVRAVIKEVMRWRPVTAGGLPHYSTKDEVYDGFFIPKDTNLHPNQWAIHREPELYPDPESFNPNRWLQPGYPTYKEPLTVYPNLHNYSCFGFGRRICPGQNIAERSLNILVSKIAWACDIRPVKDSAGKDILPPLYDYMAGFNTQPAPFKFALEARSPERAKLVKQDMEREMKIDPLASRSSG